MNATNHFLDLLGAREREAGRSGADYALRKILKCAPQMIYAYRAGRRDLSEAHCLLVAHALGIDPLHVFAAVEADRTKNPEARRVWNDAAKRASRAAAFLLAVLMAQGAPSRAELSSNSAPVRDSAHCIKRPILNSRTRRRGGARAPLH